MRVIWYFSSTCARYQAGGTVGTGGKGGGDLGEEDPRSLPHVFLDR